MAKTRNSAGINTGGKGSSNVNPLYKAATSFTNYVGNVAREVRDVPTAIGTVYKNRQSGINAKRAEFNFGKMQDEGDTKNLRNQIGEVFTALKTGKKGTTSQKSTVIEKYTPKKYMATYTDMPKKRK